MLNPASHKLESRGTCSTGFDFLNCVRNKTLLQQGYTPPKPFSSGTTIVGLIYKGGVIIGADSRQTTEHTVNSNTVDKIKQLQENIYCSGCGSAADLDNMADLAAAQLELHRLNTNRRVPVVCANKLIKSVLYRFGGSIQANFMIAGVDNKGLQLYCTRFDGCSDHVPFATLGSGQFVAMGVLENRFEMNMSECDARELVYSAVQLAIDQDLYSGGVVCMCIIRLDGSVEMIGEADSQSDFNIDSNNVSQCSQLLQPSKLLQSSGNPFQSSSSSSSTGTASVHQLILDKVLVLTEKVTYLNLEQPPEQKQPQQSGRNKRKSKSNNNSNNTAKRPRHSGFKRGGSGDGGPPAKRRRC